MGSGNILFEVSNLHHKYGNNEVFESLSLVIESGHFYTILGENGAGKSTLMRLLAGMEDFNSGSIKIAGQKSIGSNFQVSEPIALITEDLNFDINAGLRDLVNCFSRFYENWNQQQFDSYLDSRNFDLNRTFASMSRGQRVQFSLMLYLSTGIKTFILDEVTSVLDLRSREFFLAELKRVVANGGTIVFATNIIEEVENISDRVLILRDKKMSLSMDIADIPQHFFRLLRPKESEDSDLYNCSIFRDQNSQRAGHDFEGREIYIVSRDTFKKYSGLESLLDSRPLKLSDVFIHYFNVEQEVIDETAA